VKVEIVKVGGNELASPGYLERVVEAIGTRVAAGTKVVLVHGGGREVDRWLARLGIAPAYVAGQRVTDEATLTVVEAVLAGSVNKEVVRAFVARGVEALGVSGSDLGILPVVPWEGLGLVGRASVAAADPLRRLLEVCEVLVLAPLGFGQDDHRAYNVNADHAAAAVAAALGAPLALVTDVPGVLQDGAVIGQLTARQVQQLVEDGVIRAGMVPKVEAALGAIGRGAPAAIVVDLAGLGTGGTAIVPGGV
jgi:acetylglutamate kinase